MHNDFLEASVFHMKKPVRGHGHLVQTNKADSEIPWSSHYTECSVNLKSIRLRDKCSCSNHEKELTILSWNCWLPKKSSQTTIFLLKHLNFH